MTPPHIRHRPRMQGAPSCQQERRQRAPIRARVAITARTQGSASGTNLPPWPGCQRAPTGALSCGGGRKDNPHRRAGAGSSAGGRVGAGLRADQRVDRAADSGRRRRPVLGADGRRGMGARAPRGGAADRRRGFVEGGLGDVRPLAAAPGREHRDGVARASPTEVEVEKREKETAKTNMGVRLRRRDRARKVIVYATGAASGVACRVSAGRQHCGRATMSNASVAPGKRSLEAPCLARGRRLRTL